MSLVKADSRRDSDRSTLACCRPNLTAASPSRAAIGLVVLATDQTLEHEFRAPRQPARRCVLRVARLQRQRHHSRNVARHRRQDRAERRPDPSQHRARRRGVWLHFGDHDARRGGGLRRNSQGSAECRLYDPGHRGARGFRALGAARIGLLTPYAPEINTELRQIFQRSRRRTSPPSPPSIGATTARRRVSRVASIEARRAAGRDVRQSMRFSSPAPACASRRPSSAWRNAIGRSDHLEQSRDGVALPEARGDRGSATGGRAAV